MEKRCKPLVSAMQTAARKAPRGTNQHDLLAEVLKKPPKMKGDDLGRCTDLLERAFQAYLVAAIEVEAKTFTHAIALALVHAYEGTGALCPSTDKPVPADLAAVAAGAYTSTPDEWSAPTWKCLGFDLAGQTQRFQYEVRTDDQAKSFEVVARGSPLRDGRVITFVQRGRVAGKRIELAPLARQ